MKEKKQSQWKWFFNEWKAHKASAILLLIFTLISTAVAVGTPIFFKMMIDSLGQLSGSVEHLSDTRGRFLWMLLVIGLGKLMAGWYPALRARMNLIFETSLRKRYFKEIMRQPQTFVEQFRCGDLITRLTDDLSRYPKVSWFACSGIFRALEAFVVVFVCILSMAVLNPVLAVLCLLPIPVIFVVYSKITSKLDEGYEQIQKQISTTNSHLDSCFTNIKTLKAYNAESQEKFRFSKALEDRMGKEFEMVRLQSKMSVFYECVNSVSQIVVVFAGGYMVLSGEISLGIFYAFFSYLGIIVYPMLDIPHMFVVARQAFSCVSRLKELECEKLPEPEWESFEKLDSISLKSVSFRYKRGIPRVLRNINLCFKKGEKIAIMGEIGSGKSTLLSLLAGVFEPEKGKVLLNGISMRKVEKAALSHKMGYIAQQPILFSESVRNNVSFWRAMDFNDVQRGVQLSRLEEEVKHLPNHYDELLGERGVNFSGGQKQRFTIARALAGNPCLLLMDDVTASLDARNEEEFWQSIDDSLENMIVIAVTHRLATARRADKVVFLSRGKVEDVGTWQELMQRCPAFKRLTTPKEEESFDEYEDAAVFSA